MEDTYDILLKEINKLNKYSDSEYGYYEFLKEKYFNIYIRLRELDFNLFGNGLILRLLKVNSPQNNDLAMQSSLCHFAMSMNKNFSIVEKLWFDPNKPISQSFKNQDFYLKKVYEELDHQIDKKNNINTFKITDAIHSYHRLTLFHELPHLINQYGEGIITERYIDVLKLYNKKIYVIYSSNNYSCKLLQLNGLNVIQLKSIDDLNKYDDIHDNIVFIENISKIENGLFFKKFKVGTIFAFIGRTKIFKTNTFHKLVNKYIKLKTMKNLDVITGICYHNIMKEYLFIQQKIK